MLATIGKSEDIIGQNVLNTTPCSRTGKWKHSFMHLHLCVKRISVQGLSYRRLGGLQSWSGHYEKEKNFLPLFGINLQLVQPVT
jgi:hypothetical protein